MLALVNQMMIAGYTAKNILDFLKRKVVGFEKGIEDARKQGHDDDSILKFLSNKIKPLNTKKAQEQASAQDQYFKEAGIKTRGEREETTNKFLQQAIGVGSGALGAYALSRAVPQVAQSLMKTPIAGSLSKNLQSNLQQTQSPQINTSLEQKAPVQSTQTSQPPVANPNITQQQQVIQPELKTINVDELLTKSGLKKHVDELSQRIKDPKQIAAILYNKFPQEMKSFQKEAGKNMEDAIGDYLGQPASKENLPAEKKPVMLPSGEVGLVESEKDGIAKLNIDGKTKHRKMDELVESPLPEKELADLYEDLISGIEKEGGQEVSRNVYWAGYDPNTNELAYLPHDGGLYIYDDISEQDAKELTNILSKRKSTGENYIGAWTKGTSSPIGAQMYQLIQRLQKERGGKGKEYSNKFQKVYDALEIAKIAKKKKHESRKKAKKPGFD